MHTVIIVWYTNSPYKFTIFSTTLCIQGGKPKLQEGDAVLIARAWFNVGEKLTVSKIIEECDDLGLAPPEKQMKLRAALAHLGNELVDNQLLNLKRPAGITVKDIEFTIPRSVDNN